MSGVSAWLCSDVRAALTCRGANATRQPTCMLLSSTSSGLLTHIAWMIVAAAAALPASVAAPSVSTAAPLAGWLLVKLALAMMEARVKEPMEGWAEGARGLCVAELTLQPGTAAGNKGHGRAHKTVVHSAWPAAHAVFAIVQVQAPPTWM